MLVMPQQEGSCPREKKVHGQTLDLTIQPHPSTKPRQPDVRVTRKTKIDLSALCFPARPPAPLAGGVRARFRGVNSVSFGDLKKIENTVVENRKDLGLAKVIKHSEAGVDEFYRMSGEVGSLRYMAPEVASQYP